jgi:glucosamine--fructose-6-phosphate aminotransferase (isomerizing)
MCGIVGFTGNNEAAPILLDGLSKLEYRGYDSAGIAVRNGDAEPEIVKAKGKLKVLKEMTNDGKAVKGACGIGHTRWATHGEPSTVNAHPHCSDDENVIAVHNGIIENYQELREKLIKKGYTFKSETDTEVAVKLIDYYYKKYLGTPVDALNHALVRIRGSYALAVMFKDYPGEIYAARKDSPMIIGVTGGESYLASDVPAILKYTRNVYYIGNMELAKLTKGAVAFYNLDGEEIQKEMKTIEWDAEAAEKSGYEHFMLKEIHEQPKVIKDTINSVLTDGNISFESVGLSDEDMKNIQQVYIVACGSAYHVGMVAQYVIEELTSLSVRVELASEFRYRQMKLAKNSLAIIISQSGETSDTLAALRLAKSRDVPVLAVVNVVGSSIARAADYVLYTYAGPEIAVASTKAYMVQLCTLYLFAFRLAYARGRLSEAETRRLTAELLRAGEVIQPRLADCEQIKYLASRFVNTQSCFFIGRGFDYALSLEGSLKLKEISYVHSDAYAAGELKHGTISLITDGVPVIALATQKQVYEKTISNAKETKSRGARVILFTTKDVVVPEGVADYVVRLDDYDELLMPLQLIVPLQLFAYYMAVLRGCDVDKPRNLAKSVTVE